METLSLVLNVAIIIADVALIAVMIRRWKK